MRNALRGVHTAISFTEEVAGVEHTAKLTTSQVYLVIQKEVLANTIRRRPTKQAPRMLLVMLSTLEEVVGNIPSDLLSDLPVVDYRAVLEDAEIPTTTAEYGQKTCSSQAVR